MTTFKNQKKRNLTIKQDPNLKTQNYYKNENTQHYIYKKTITARNDNNMITKIIISVIKK